MVCVQCKNLKYINSTNNRLVTESCGHVKCMDCLLNEKSGCNICLKKTKSRNPRANIVKGVGKYFQPTSK